MEESNAFCTDYLGNMEAAGIPKSRHIDRFQGGETSGYKINECTDICGDENTFLCVEAHS